MYSLSFLLPSLPACLCHQAFIIPFLPDRGVQIVDSFGSNPSNSNPSGIIKIFTRCYNNDIYLGLNKSGKKAEEPSVSIYIIDIIYYNTIIVLYYIEIKYKLVW